jgi:hypothetical protein
MNTKRILCNCLLIFGATELIVISLTIIFRLRDTVVGHLLFTGCIAICCIGLYALFWFMSWLRLIEQTKRPSAKRLILAHFVGLLPFYVGLAIYYRAINPLDWQMDWPRFAANFLVLAIASGGLRALVSNDLKKCKMHLHNNPSNHQPGNTPP